MPNDLAATVGNDAGQRCADACARLGLTGDLAAVAIGHANHAGTGKPLSVASPIDGSAVASMTMAEPAQVQQAIDAAHDAYVQWRVVPAPIRGHFVRRLGELLREHQDDLGTIVCCEMGKSYAEAVGEVQEMIDIAEFAIGLSRQLHGLTIASERPGHRLMEQYQPLGAVGVISAFNFPVAVWAWNAMLAWVCGDAVVWKPSEKTPLSALACQKIVTKAMSEMPDVPEAISCVAVGGVDVGHAIASSPKLPLVSATGSTRMGKAVAQVVAARLGRSLLELGGNNAMILTPSADVGLAVRAITFAAVGTAGQRCTTLRRLIAHRSVADDAVAKLKKIYEQLSIGDPTDPSNHVGPLVDEAAYDAMQSALERAQAQGGKLITGGQRVTQGVPEGGVYVRPAIVEIGHDADVVQEETFAPLLYVIRFDDFDDAIAIHNNVPQGLSSAVFTSDVREAETFLSPAGSDCGIANVNIGTSGAEIGGAFGGEKDTGGGRESGSDAWKAYMRRATNTINYSDALPLAQGIKFDV
ncbi:MAG: aldehyde dehydrogenase family protein [Planctomycetota bacterium]